SEQSAWRSAAPLSPWERGRSPRFVARIRPKAASGMTVRPGSSTTASCDAPGALRLPGLRVADEPASPCERAGAVVYAQPCSRPARVVVREIHLASEHAADSPCTPVAPRTLTSKHAPVGRGEVAAFCSPDKAEGRIRGMAVHPGSAATNFMRGPGCASLTRATRAPQPPASRQVRCITCALLARACRWTLGCCR